MLESLHVKNYVLIDNLDLDFSNGFSCITGETGSGKTIILGALSLLLGAKADKEAIRKGSDFAEISGVFSFSSDSIALWLDDHGIDHEDGEILIRRVIKSNGRTTYSVNGSAIARGEGEELGELLVDVSSQHANQFLRKNEYLRAILDEALNANEILASYQKEYTLLKSKEKEEAELEESIKRNLEESDYIRFCLNELDKGDLKEGEEEDLKSKIALISNSEFLASSLTESTNEMKNAISSLESALSVLRKAGKKDPRLDEYSSRLESSSIECEDIFQSLREHLDSISFSEFELEEMNTRLSTIQRLKRRFGGSVEEAIKIREDYRKRLEECEESDQIIKKLHSEISEIKKRAEALAEKLSKKRKSGAVLLAKKIEDNLHKLGMNSARMDIRVDALEEMSNTGRDLISFLIAANKGEKYSLIQNTASGGELSRLMLSLKVSVESAGEIDTLLFDEIDAGIGGVVANNVADELKNLSSSHQVLAITHLPQLAAKADRHYLVYKKEIDGRTVSFINQITGDERVKEIARLLSGETSDISLEHARRLLEVQA